MTDDAALFFTKGASFRFPITPPPFKNKGNYVVSLSKITKWLGGLVENAGVNLFTQFGGASLIYEGDGIAGVITEDKGLDKNGKPKDNYTPGYELRAKVTVLAEGTRGSLTKQLVAKKKLDNRGMWRTRWAGRFLPTCTVADGFMDCPTIGSRSDSSSPWNIPIRSLILTQRFRFGRRIRS